MIKHVWFDFSETLAHVRKDLHDQLLHATYSSVVGRPVTKELIAEYEDLYTKNKHSNSAVFRALGMPQGFWPDRMNTLPPKDLYVLTDKDVPETLRMLKDKVSISLFSNIDLAKVSPALGIKMEWFTHVLTGRMIAEPKPALDGFYKMIELTALPAGEILYVGDDVGKDILPAKKVGIKTGLVWSLSDEADYCFGEFEDILDLFD